MSYKIQGIAFEVRKNFGLGHKEQIYQKAFEEELKMETIPYEREKAIKIYSPKDGKFIGLYRPDFIIDKKIIIEMKTLKFVPKEEMRKIYDYLRNSKYELGYLINFASPKLFIKRIIFTNDRKDWFKRVLVFVSILFVLFSGLNAQAARLYLEPAQGQYQSGDTFIVEIKIDTEEEYINTVEANLSFSKDILKAVDFSKGGSILTLWLKEPEINEDSGLISFSGGIPGGYRGGIPGDPGLSNSLGKIIFKVSGMKVGDLAENSAKVDFLESSQILLNDGLGTKVKIIAQGANFKISEKPELVLEPTSESTSEPVLEPTDEWQEEIEKDDIPPEPFSIEVYQDEMIFEGKYSAVFFTTDKQTGLDHYEIKEGQRDWKTAQSPYLLEDQKLQSIIEVKAVDKAGNERIAEYTPEIAENFLLYWMIVLIFGGIGVSYWIIKKSKTKTKK